MNTTATRLVMGLLWLSFAYSLLAQEAPIREFLLTDQSGRQPCAADRDLSGVPSRRRTITEVYGIFEDLPIKGSSPFRADQNPI